MPVTYRNAHSAASKVTFLQFPKPISIRVSLIDFSQSDVHEIVAINEMAIECFPIFEFDQHWPILCRIKE